MPASRPSQTFAQTLQTLEPAPTAFLLVKVACVVSVDMVVTAALTTLFVLVRLHFKH